MPIGWGCRRARSSRATADLGGQLELVDDPLLETLRGLRGGGGGAPLADPPSERNVLAYTPHRRRNGGDVVDGDDQSVLTVAQVFRGAPARGCHHRPSRAHRLERDEAERLL